MTLLSKIDSCAVGNFCLEGNKKGCFYKNEKWKEEGYSLDLYGVYWTKYTFFTAYQYYKLTRKSNPFHGFLNGLTQPVYSVFQS